jgi:O-antigen biosynthesis protein
MFRELKRIVLLSIQTLRMFGINFLIKEVIRYIRFGPLPVVSVNDYKVFREKYCIPYSDEDINKIKNSIHINPLISVIIPVYNVEPEYLDICINSVLNQKYTNWELCIYDDVSTNKNTIECLNKWENIDSRIKIQYGKVNKHISYASNKAIEMANGDYIALLDNDDELDIDALLDVVIYINRYTNVDFIYTDEDLISPTGEYSNPHFKSDFNKELLLSHNYITHFSIIKKSLGDKIGWFRQGYEGAQDHDLFLRMIEHTTNIYHIPKILYHWRQTKTSTSFNYHLKSYSNESSIKALQDYSQRNKIKAEVLIGPGTGAYRFKRQVLTSKKVSIIIPFKDQINYLKPCIESIITLAGYENFEILLVSNNSEENITKDYLKKITKKDNRIKVLEYNIPFNFSEINNWAVNKSEGEYILLLNNDTKAIEKDWLNSMIEYIQLDEVGVVGAKLLYGDSTIQHAGVIIGISGIAGHSHRFFHDSSNGYYYRPTLPQNLNAVTGACLLTKREIWDEVGGLDSENFKIAFNDIDYCLKVRQLGYNIVYTPYSKLYHYESKSRGYETTPDKIKRFDYECELLKKKWNTDNYKDSFYNINLTHQREDFSIKM